VPFAGLDLPEQWPQVPIVYGCVEPEPLVLRACLNAGVAGLVFTGTGAGQLSVGECRVLEAWAGPRPLMLRANRCGSGPVHGCPEDQRLGLLAAGSLNPQKARVLVLLCLIAGLDRAGLSAQLLKLDPVN
jgi:L-asparaginase